MIAGAEVLDWTRQVDVVTVPLIGQLAPWQFTFVAVGLPGLIIAALFATLREPRRKGRTGNVDQVPPWRDVWAYIRAHRRIYLALHLGVPFIVIMLYGLQSWVPTILVRVYEWDLADAGRRYGLVALVAGSAGVLAGPVVAVWLRRLGYIDAPLRVAILGAASATVCLVTLPWVDGGGAALAVIGGASFSVTLPLALITTTMQEVTPNAMRGVVNGLYVVTTNVLGLALGPTLVAACTDFVFQDTGAVAKSLAVVSVLMGPVAVVLLASGLKPYAALKRDAADVGT
jgi:sugar phosphate permease